VAKGQANSGMFKVVIGRTASAAGGHDVSKEMGVNTWAAFAGTDDNAVVDGDFAMLESEHYWGRGSADALARGVRSALETQK